MEIEEYLARINYTEKLERDYNTFLRLHELHVFNVPFENLDVHHKRPFNLILDDIYKKVVKNGRGGFCYELNSLFSSLLANLGFSSRIISARIFDDAGVKGPPYDHMSVLVQIQNKKYLADVGCGDLFIKPLEVTNGIQTDGRNWFLIEGNEESEFTLSMSSDSVTFVKKYAFTWANVDITDFEAICIDKQTSMASYFVKNIVCTKPTNSGRLTIFNNKLIEKRNSERLEKLIENDCELRNLLREKFGIVVS